MSMQTDPTQKQRSRTMTKGAKVAMVCGVGCVTLALGSAVLIGAGWCFKYAAAQRIAGYEREFRALGFTKIVSQSGIIVREAPTEATVYKGATVSIQVDCPTNIAIIALSGDISSVVDGRVYFRGMTLTVHPKSRLNGGLHAVAMTVTTNGFVGKPMAFKPLLGQRVNVLPQKTYRTG